MNSRNACSLWPSLGFVLISLMDQERVKAIMDERDRLYSERHNSLEKAVGLALNTSDKAVAKAETAIEKRLDGVNEFRATLADQQRLLMPRAEVEVIVNSLNERIATLKERLDALQAERAGIKGGWGYAVGVVGLVMIIISIATMAMRMVK